MTRRGGSLAVPSADLPRVARLEDACPEVLGYSIGMMTQTLNSPTMFGWGGSGGTIAFADTAGRTAYALTKNRHSAGDFSTADLVFNR